MSSTAESELIQRQLAVGSPVIIRRGSITVCESKPMSIRETDVGCRRIMACSLQINLNEPGKEHLPHWLSTHPPCRDKGLGPFPFASLAEFFHDAKATFGL